MLKHKEQQDNNLLSSLEPEVSEINSSVKARQTIKKAYDAVEQKQVDTLSEIGEKLLNPMVEYVESEQIEKCAKQVVETLKENGSKAGVSAWYHHTASSLRRIEDYSTAIEYNKRASKAALKAKNPSAFVISELGTCATLTSAGEYGKASEKLAKLEQKIDQEDLHLRSQFCFEQVRLAAEAYDNETLMYRSFEAEDLFSEFPHSHLSRATCMAYATLGMVRNGIAKHSYRYAIISFYPIFKENRYFLFFKLHEGFLHSIKSSMFYPEERKVVALLERMNQQWHFTNHVSCNFRRRFLDALSHLYAFYLSHHGSPKEVYNNPYLGSLPREAGPDGYLAQKEAESKYGYI